MPVSRAGETGRVTVEEDVVFGVGGGRDLKCDIYTPPGRTERAPAVLLLHGGGWRSGDRKQLPGYGILLGRDGYLCVCSEYRLVGEAAWPAQIHDVKAAVRWMRASSERLGLDPTKIAVQGNSAGAHLALVAAGTPNVSAFEGEGGNEGVASHVEAAISIYGPTDFRESVLSERVADLMGADRSAERLRAASPMTYVDDSFPPTLLIQGTDDKVVPPGHSIRMNDALRGEGVPVELHLYAGQPHAFDSQRAFGRQCASIMSLFLSRYVVKDQGLAEEPTEAGAAVRGEVAGARREIAMRLGDG